MFYSSYNNISYSTNRQPANHPSAVTPFPLPSYDIFPADIKTEGQGDETKEPPPNYSPPSSPVPNEIPAYYWEPMSADAALWLIS